jgi:hypothetical protein
MGKYLFLKKREEIVKKSGKFVQQLLSATGFPDHNKI